ncbi:hypothetical protein CYMTET_48408 [Cymbomonas tetramitiformis]|uniref:Uncharacterized protein n=1 Tax=Cymbomonas tetramitiformis TaxID=36881 RepID=A0AAE0BSG1_9CHLO|nr:hypothetical protein CYMTET_48408 [Cymbomonas tetramitiformis]
MPQLYDLYGDKTFDSLAEKASSSLKYEQLVLTHVLAFLYDAVQYSEGTVDLLDDQAKNPVSAQEIEQRVCETHNTEKVYNSSEGFVAESIFNQWLLEFDATRQRAVLNNTAKKATQSGRFQDRERKPNPRGAGGSGSRTLPSNNAGRGKGKGGGVGRGAGSDV